MFSSLFKSIISWVDSHIINYPTAIMKLNKNRFLLVLCCIIFVSTIMASPITTMIGLLLFTIYFLYSEEYKKILVIWGFFFSVWYFTFTACLLDYDGPIIIGNENTALIFNHLSIKYPGFYYSFSFFRNVVFESFCFQTVLILHSLSSKLGFSIYIPSVLKVLLTLVKFFWGGVGLQLNAPLRKVLIHL